MDMYLNFYESRRVARKPTIHVVLKAAEIWRTETVRLHSDGLQKVFSDMRATTGCRWKVLRMINEWTTDPQKWPGALVNSPLNIWVRIQRPVKDLAMNLWISMEQCFSS